jgi:hypothetical protein
MKNMVQTATMMVDSNCFFIKPLYSNIQDNQLKSQLYDLPTEVFVLIAMSSGFYGCMNLRNTCARFKRILDMKSNWNSFTERSPDVIETLVTIETKLHQFDRIVFGEWTKNNMVLPTIIHKTFQEEYDFLGGMSLVAEINGRVGVEFFDHRETLPCYINDVQTRMRNGLLPRVTVTGTSPVGGVRIPHSCNECSHYDNVTIVKSEFIHKSLSENDELFHTYQVGPKRFVNVSVQHIHGVFGYSNDIPSITVKVNKIDSRTLSRGHLNLYIKYIL